MTDVKHELTNRPVDQLSQAALKAEWSEAYERIASGTTEDLDAAWDRRHELWQEMRDRTDADSPECPECGASSWSQELGGPKHCNGCGFAPTDEDMELIQEIDSYWRSVKAVDDLEDGDRVVTDGGQSMGPNGIPYADIDRTEVGLWESGDYRVRLARDSGRSLNANFTEAQLKALQSAIERVLKEGGGQ